MTISPSISPISFVALIREFESFSHHDLNLSEEDELVTVSGICVIVEWKACAIVMICVYSGNGLKTA